MGYVTRKPVAEPHPTPVTKMAPYNGGWGEILPFEQWPNYKEAKENVPDIKKLLQASDFIGVSNYARYVCSGSLLRRMPDLSVNDAIVEVVSSVSAVKT